MLIIDLGILNDFLLDKTRTKASNRLITKTIH